MKKEIIRKTALKSRLLQSDNDFVQKSIAICNKIISIDLFNPDNCRGKNISLYNTHKKEVNLDFLRDYFVANHANCYFPITCNNEIIFGKYNKDKDFCEQCQTGELGIIEPIIPCDSFVTMDWIFIPGIAYDFLGNRIGYGKGYYDRYLTNYSNLPFIIAPAFELQIYDEIICQEHDIPVDLIVTEQRIILPRKGASNEKE